MVVVVQAILFICKNGDGLPYAREDSDRNMLFYILEAGDDYEVKYTG